IVATDISKKFSISMSCIGGLKPFGAKKCLLLQFRDLNEKIDFSGIYSSDLVDEYEKMLARQKIEIEKEGFEVETRVLPGFSPSKINMICKEEGYSLTVTASKKHSSPGEVSLGRIANDLIHSAQFPVLLIKPENYTEEREGDGTEGTLFDINSHVLYPTDFSENADIAFKYIRELSAGIAKKIVLLHVQDKSRITPHLESRIEEFNKLDEARLKGMKDMLEKEGRAEIKTMVRYGSPSLEILRLAEDMGIKLIVMGSQGRGYVKEFFLGSVSQNIARVSPSSVLLIPTSH
ncbi:MAG: universal stress protein, partial [Eubacteriales bacterium]|nr:universal stress protein [Eubacteriales bacterium]